MNKQRILTIFSLFFLLALLGPSRIFAFSTQCDILFDDFSNSFSFFTTYTTRNADWSIQDGKLTVSNKTEEMVATAERSFSPEAPFSVDIDLVDISGGSDNYVGLYVYTDGDVLFDVDGVTTDGMEVIVYPNSGRVYFYYWDVLEGNWRSQGPYEISGALSSFGLTFTEDKVIFRQNGQDTDIEIEGYFNGFDLVLDRMWIEASGDSISASFDNLCARTYVPQSTGNGSSSTTGGFSLPSSKAIYPVSPAATPSTSGTKSDINPFGLGAVAAGGQTMDLLVALPAYASPVDIFLVLVTNLAPDEIFLFDASNNIQSLSQGVFVWKSGVQSPINETIFSGLPTSLFGPGASFKFMLFVVPANDMTFEAYDAWATQIVLGGGAETGNGSQTSGGQGTGGGSSSGTGGGESSSTGTLRGEITGNVDEIMAILPSLTGFYDQLSGILDGATSDSDIITISPNDISLFNLPSTITVDINFGSGYTLKNGSVLTGTARLVLTNVHMGNTGMGADFSLTANHITMDGSEVLDGSSSGTLSITMSSSGSGNLSGNIVLTGLRVNGQPLQGKINIQGTNITDLSEGLFEQITLTPQNVSYGDFTITSGSVTIQRPSAANMKVSLDLSTSEGPIDLDLNIAYSESGGYVISTPSAGTVMGYGVEVYGLNYNSSVCKDYPIGGTIGISKDGETGVIGFTNSCDGTYTYTE